MDIKSLIRCLKAHQSALKGGSCDNCDLINCQDCEDKLLLHVCKTLSTLIPRVISYEEAILSGAMSPEIFYIEFHGDPYVEPAFVQVATEKGAYIITPMGPVSIKRHQDGKLYRLWSAMPSQDVSQSTEWGVTNA